MSKICSCFGKCKNVNKVGLEESLFVLFEDLIKVQGFDTFCFGGMGEFDELCFKVVKKLQSEHGRIKTVLVCPKFKDAKLEFDAETKARFDECVTFDGKNEFAKMPVLSRNLEVSKASSFVVFFADERGASNETKVLEYAKEKNIPHINFY